MVDPTAISVQQISAAVQASVQKALQGRNAALSTAGHTVGIVSQPPHWVGIVYNNPQRQLPEAEAQQLANDVAEASKSLPGLQDIEGHVYYGPDYVTVGFRLPDPLIAKE